MQKQIEKIYFNDFVPKVAKGRGKTNEEVNTIAQGRVWTGTQAKQVGLIDEFGGLEKAIEIAKELANLPADRDVKRISFPEPRPFFDTMFGSSEENTMTQEQQAATALVKSLPEEMRRSFRYAAMLDQMRNGEAMLLLPYELEVK